MECGFRGSRGRYLTSAGELMHRDATAVGSSWDPGTSPFGLARRRLLMVVGLFVSATLVGGGLWAWWHRGATPTLTDAALTAAEVRWETAGPPSYDLDLVIEGRQPGDVHIEVRSGVVTAMTRDGRTPSQRRTWDYWTVPNQFATIRQDCASAQNPAGGFGAPPGSRVLQRARFDAEYGYPLRYERTVLGTPLDVRWHITTFSVRE